MFSSIRKARLDFPKKRKYLRRAMKREELVPEPTAMTTLVEDRAHVAGLALPLHELDRVAHDIEPARHFQCLLSSLPEYGHVRVSQ